MQYLILFFGVFSFFTFVAWRDPARGRAFPREAPLPAKGTGKAQGAPAAATSADVFARLLKGEWKEDKPCLTPIDCVRDVRCAGHCGCH